MRRSFTNLVIASFLGSVALPVRADEPRAHELEQRVAALEQELAALRKEVAGLKQRGAPSERAGEVKVFPLRNSDATRVASLLAQLFDTDSRLRVVADARTNSVIVVGESELLLTIEALLIRLDEADTARTEAGDVGQSLRKQVQVQAAELKARLAQAQADVLQRQEKLRFTQRMLEKGFASKLQVEAEQAALNAAQAVLEQARAGLEALSPEAPTVEAPEE